MNGFSEGLEQRLAPLGEFGPDGDAALGVERVGGGEVVLEIPRQIG